MGGEDASAFFVGFSIKFATDGTYKTFENGVEDNEQGTWEFTSSDTKLMMDKGTEYESEMTIVTLSENVLTFSGIMEGITIVMTFGK